MNDKKFVEYKFWKNYGKIIYDYSLNGRHAINGLSLSDTTKASKFTDRGVYMETLNTLTLPPNELASSFALSDPFTILFWISMADLTGQIFLRSCSSYSIGIHRHNSTSFNVWAFTNQYLLSQNTKAFLVCN